MKLSAKTDIEAPIELVYQTLADHASWEREALRRGVEVTRPAGMPLDGVGAGWRVRVPFRGKLRRILLQIDALSPDARMVIGLDGQSIAGSAVVDLAVLSPRRTRLRLQLELTSKTLTSRFFLNTLRLAKGRVQARLQLRLAQFAARVEERHAHSRASQKV